MADRGPLPKRRPRAPRVHRPTWAQVVSFEPALRVLVADHSPTGVRIHDPSHSLEPGDEIDLEIHFETGSPLVVTGTVARVTPDGYALEFEVAPADRTRWTESLRRLLTA